MKVSAAEWCWVNLQGRQVSPASESRSRPALAIVLDGRPVMFDSEQRWLDRGYSLVFLGSGWAGQVPEIVIDPDPARGPDARMVLRGFTDDPTVVSLVRAFAEALAAETWEPRKLL